MTNLPSTLFPDFLTLAKLALAGSAQDAQLYLSKLARKYQKHDPDTGNAIASLLAEGANRANQFRKVADAPLPVDGDSRLHLLRVEVPSAAPERPILPVDIEGQISDIVRERTQLAELARVGLEPTRSALFVGPPGVGKTLTARWIASTLGLPLFVLDLSAVMSSFLGKTGNNVRAVLDHAKRQNCVLLLDELDAIAKRRDDSTEIGELKRLVTVLLQEIDEWPATGLLIAATNHPELLDPAVWRRFDHVIKFPNPTTGDIQTAIISFFGEDADQIADWLPGLTAVFDRVSFSFIEKQVASIRRRALLKRIPIAEEIEKFVAQMVLTLSHAERLALATRMQDIPGLTQRKISDLTGVSRDTIRQSSVKPIRKKERGSNGAKA